MLVFRKLIQEYQEHGSFAIELTSVVRHECEDVIITLGILIFKLDFKIIFFNAISRMVEILLFHYYETKGRKSDTT